jgi:hypothetical protein
MKAYAKAIAYAMVATILLAIVTRKLGYNMIGTDLETNLQYGAIFGGLVSALAGVPALACRWCRNFAASLGLGAAVALLPWAIECLAWPGTNAGFGWTHAEHVAGIGLLIGYAMWRSRQIGPFLRLDLHIKS